MVERVDDELLTRAVAAIIKAARELGASPRSAAGGVRDSADAREVLQRLSRALEITGTAGSARHEVALAQAELNASELARQRAQVPVLTQALTDLRSASTIDELADAVPYRCVQLGYDRVLFSWVDQEHWVPRAAHITDQPAMSRALVSAGGPPYAHTRDLLEVDVVRARRPLLVRDVEGNPRVHQRLWAITRSRGYVAAPVVARGRVAALVHLDRHVDNDPTDEFDRDLVAAFCQGVGLMIDHLFSTGGPGSGSTSHLTSTWHAALTTRELEVLQLVAAGLTNAEVGERLFISDETVKTHLRRLMRKLGLSRRTQAAAAYTELRRLHRRGSADSGRSVPRTLGGPEAG